MTVEWVQDVCTHTVIYYIKAGQKLSLRYKQNGNHWLAFVAKEPTCMMYLSDDNLEDVQMETC
jgi:TfoX/Sxy family transcriptional regulator of competence genes